MSGDSAATCDECGDESNHDSMGAVPMSHVTDDPSTAPEPTITNPMCPCWSGYHFLHRPTRGCPTCEPLDAQLRADLAAVKEAEQEALRRG